MTARQSHNDTVVVGTSIVAMFEAILSAKRGRSVLMVDRAPVVGGAWRTWETDHCTGLNNGSHLFRNHPVYQGFITAHSGAKFAPLVPQPESYWGDTRLLEDSPLQHTAVFAQRLWQLTRSLTGATPRDIASRRRYALTLLRFPLTLGRAVLRPHGPFTYPEGGLADLLESLRRQLRDLKVEVVLDTTVHHLDLGATAAGVDVVTDRGSFHGGQVVLFTNTVFARSPTFALDPVEPLRTMRYPHLALVVEDRTPRAFSHLSFLSDPTIVRINDYTDVVDIRPEHRGKPIKILQAWVRDATVERREQAEQVVATLRRLGRLGDDARLLDVRFFDHEVSINSTANLRAIERAHGPRVRVIDSFSMVDGVLDVARRWKESLG